MQENRFPGGWDAVSFFRDLCARNRLAREHDFRFCHVSGLEGFQQALEQAQTARAFFCVSDTSEGYTSLHNTPRTRRVKTVMMAMRHAPEDMQARARCMETMRTLFTQLMSALLPERTRLEQGFIYIDPRITFTEVDRYFFTGCACAYFQIAADCPTDLRYEPDHWL